MIIEVQERNRPFSPLRYHYNAPPSIKVGDLVEVPSASGAHTWVAKVTRTDTAAARSLLSSGWTGTIKAIVGRTPLKVEVEANTRSELRAKLQDALDDLDEELIR